MMRVLKWGLVVAVVAVVGLLFLPDDAMEEAAGGADPAPRDGGGEAREPVVVADPGDEPSGEPAGTWTEGPCPVDPGDTEVDVTCGTLSVPASRAVSDGPTIDLAVAVLHRVDDPGLPDPVLYLTGGPGGSALAELEVWATDSLLESRDIILLDQRGTGWSRPPLQCPESHDAEDGQAQYDALVACRDRLVDAGVDLDTYRTEEIAADVADLRVALGYDEWNLWGSSYGTRVALAVLRDHPEGVRSVVLESAYPMDSDAYADTVAAGTAAVDGLFDLCAADTACAGAFGDLADVFAATAARLDGEPVVLADEDGTELDGLAFAEAVVAGVGQSAAIPLLPAWITAIAAGDDEPLDALVERRGYGHDTREDSEPVFYLVECSEEVAYSQLADVDPGAVADVFEVDPDDHVATSQADVVASTLQLCEVWDPPAADPREDEPVTSDVPSLVLAGELDPATPPWWGEQAAQTLGHGQFVLLPGMGHDLVDLHECPRGLFETFLASPTATLDTGCVAGMQVDFALPED